MTTTKEREAWRKKIGRVPAISRSVGIEMEEEEFILRLIDDVTELREMMRDFLAVTEESQGVVGYHLNGDVAVWDEFECVDDASALLDRTESPIIYREV